MRDSIRRRAMSTKRIHPIAIVADEALPARDLVGGHSLDDFFKANLRVRITADARKRIPEIRPHNVGRGKPSTDFVVPADAGLRTRMGFHRRPKIPLERPFIIALNTEAHRIHDSDELLRVGVARSRRRFEFSHRFFELAGLHEITALFDVCAAGDSEGRECESKGGDFHPAHWHSEKIALRWLSRAWSSFCTCLVSFAICISASAALADEPLGMPEGAIPVFEDDFNPFDEAQAELGRLLFYDPLLSGNRNISCGTCHHHTLAGADSLSLGLGEGGDGVGPERKASDDSGRIKRRMSRNSPALFNLGAREIRTLFHDGRVSLDDTYGNGFNTPAEEYLPQGLSSILAAQALFPLVGEIEMAGAPEENEVAAFLTERIDYGWPLIVERVRGVPEYAELFATAFVDVVSAQDIGIVHVANALGEFVGSEWRSHDSPFDSYISGDLDAMSPRQVEGLNLFFGKARCSSCHGGPFFTDQGFYALALPPLGPGRTRRFDLHARDVGRLAETDRIEDSYRFRTPMLRNVALTAPYGHNGAYSDLKGMIEHHLNPLASLDNWQRDQVELPSVNWLDDLDFIVHQDRLEMERYRKFIDIRPVFLEDDEIDALVAFMHALTGRDSVNGRLGRPERVPSGLPVD